MNNKRKKTRKVSVVRMRSKRDENIRTMLGEAKADDFRDTFRGCALTEDECDAFGIDFHQHHAGLVSGDY